MTDDIELKKKRLRLLELEKEKAMSSAAAPESTPDPSPANPPPSPLRAGVIGTTQGLTSDFGDELGASVGQFMVGDGVKLGKGAQPAADDSPMLRELKERTLEREKQAPTKYETVRGVLRDEASAAREAHPEVYIPTEVGGAVLQMFAPGLNLAKGAKLAPTAGKFAALGAATGAGASEGKLNRGELGRVAFDAGVGGLVGGVGGVAGYGMQKLLGYFGGKLMSRGADKIAKGAEKAEQMAAEAAAAETATARSAAGRAAQDAYRQLENLRDLKALRQLTPEEKAVYEMLSAELAAKSQANLVPAAAEKAATSGLYSQAVTTEADRATAKAAELMKSTAAKDAKSYFKSYGEPLLGGSGGVMIGDWADDALDLGGYGKAVGGVVGSTAMSRTRQMKALMDRIAKPGNQIGIGQTMTRLGEYLAGPSPVTRTGTKATRTGTVAGAVDDWAMPLPQAASADQGAPKGMAGVYLELINADPSALGKYGAAIAREKTPDDQLAMTEALRQTDPEFAKLFEGLKQRFLTQRGSDAQ